ncbi:MAG: class I SAM-dependent methyltransferase [Clostridia bacterium]|nr:class I SAM-dependent methyltransferase [Clostridia bacterium]
MGERNSIALDPRLSMVARLVGTCDCYADIGCDHGRLGAFMLQNNLCRRALLTDISEPSLAKARALIERLGLEERTVFRVGDGALAIDEPVQAVVIAGMGGSTIAEILRGGRERLGNARLVLQPNVAAPELRKTLCEIGYAIVDERVVQDGRRCYVILAAEPGKADYGLKERVVGPVLLERMPDELLPYARFRLRVAKKALAGALASGDDGQIAPLEREAAIWEEVLACLLR